MRAPGYVCEDHAYSGAFDLSRIHYPDKSSRILNLSQKTAALFHAKAE